MDKRPTDNSITVCGMPVTVIRSGRKTIGIQVKDGTVIVRAPRFVTRLQIQSVLQEKQGWIEKHSHTNPTPALPPYTKEELKELCRKAGEIIPLRVEKYAVQMGLSYQSVGIGVMKSRWGSCSSAKKLRFNALLLLTPLEVLDSVVVHELCHLCHMDHGPEFNRLLRRVYPLYDSARKWLNQNGPAILQRIP